jgi:hypothetical protein
MRGGWSYRYLILVMSHPRPRSSHLHGSADFARMTAANCRRGLRVLDLLCNSFDEGWGAAWLCNARELADQKTSASLVSVLSSQRSIYMRDAALASVIPPVETLSLSSVYSVACP